MEDFFCQDLQPIRQYFKQEKAGNRFQGLITNFPKDFGQHVHKARIISFALIIHNVHPFSKKFIFQKYYKFMIEDDGLRKYIFWLTLFLGNNAGACQPRLDLGGLGPSLCNLGLGSRGLWRRVCEVLLPYLFL